MDSLDLSLISTPSSAATELGATILQTNFPEAGWYLAEIDLFPGSRVYGTPLRLSSFAVGEKVTVFQCFPNGGGAEYGFAKPTEYSYGVAQIPDGYYDSFLASYKYGMSLAWLARKAKNTKVMFEPGTVVSIIRSRGIAVGLLVNMRYSLTNANLGVVAGIESVEYFSVGDGVLVSNWPGAGRAVVGWWQTANKFISTLKIDMSSAFSMVKTTNGIEVVLESIAKIGTGAKWTMFYASNDSSIQDYFNLACWGYTDTYAHQILYDLKPGGEGLILKNNTLEYNNKTEFFATSLVKFTHIATSPSNITFTRNGLPYEPEYNTEVPFRT